MAKKAEDLETDTVIAAKGTELKKELQRVLKSIVEEDNFGIEAIVEAMRILGSLKESKFKQKSEATFEVDDNIVVPKNFRCPISKGIMSDPVILANGQTNDRPYNERWLQTQHVDLTPNHLVRDMISKWCKEHGLTLPQPAFSIDEVITVADREYLNSLLQKTWSSSFTPSKKLAVKELRLLTKRMPFYRALFGESENLITQLITPLSVEEADSDIDFLEDLVITVLNISIHENNKKLVAENQNVIHLLIKAPYSRKIEIRGNAAAALFTLSALDSNRLIIRRSCALIPLMNCLKVGNPLDMKYAALTIFMLCIAPENRKTVFLMEAVKVILEKIEERKFVEDLLAILAILSGHENEVDEIVWKDAVPCLLSVIRESTCELCKEKCILILHNICNLDMSKFMREISEEENAKGTLSKLAESGTARAKRDANSFLEMLNKAGSSTNAA